MSEDNKIEQTLSRFGGSFGSTGTRRARPEGLLSGVFFVCRERARRRLGGGGGASRRSRSLRMRHSYVSFLSVPVIARRWCGGAAGTDWRHNWPMLVIDYPVLPCPVSCQKSENKIFLLMWSRDECGVESDQVWETAGSVTTTELGIKLRRMSIQAFTYRGRK